MTVRKIGNSLGVILPKGMLEEMNVKEGDELFAVKAPDGVRLTPYDPHFAKAMGIARKYMREHRNTLRELAK
ncbi:MAG: hypothetical protein A2516_00900 [Alphaproteobacteria bacterium RIFOXYD12_FULL_60_8]|nr:MAG: hypothetical protein A2516_00900 [Alphaproteobacteria bacterium RIFOXYD12_FULL_60_8]